MTPELPRRQCARLRGRARRGPRGVTLIECMIALLVLCLGGLAVARLQLALLVRGDELRAAQEASRLAHQKIEQLGAGLLDAALTGHDMPDLASNTTFERSWTVEPLPDGQGLARISATVRWRNRQGKPESASLVTLARAFDAQAAAAVLLAPSAQVHSGPTIPP